MSAKYLYAQVFLGYHLLLRLLRRIFQKKSPGLKDFVAYYHDDKITKFSRHEKELMSQWTRCISCGLCDSVCASVSTYPVGPSFLQRLIRSVPDFVGNVALDLDHCQSCGACESVCPTNVPIVQAVQFIQNKENEVFAAT